MHSVETILEDHKTWSYPITEADIAMIEDGILALIRKATGKKIRVKAGMTVTWPGLPAGQIPIRHRTIIQNMIESGVIVKVSRARTTNPNALAHFYKIA